MEEKMEKITETKAERLTGKAPPYVGHWGGT
jgi:hypothetical protein